MPIERIAQLEAEVTVMPNPQPLASPLWLHEVEEARNLHCRNYERCLTSAAEANWPSFHCGDCQIDDDLSIEELRKQSDALRASVANWNRVLPQDV